MRHTSRVRVARRSLVRLLSRVAFFLPAVSPHTLRRIFEDRNIFGLGTVRATRYGTLLQRGSDEHRLPYLFSGMYALILHDQIISHAIAGANP